MSELVNMLNTVEDYMKKNKVVMMSIFLLSKRTRKGQNPRWGKKKKTKSPVRRVL